MIASIIYLEKQFWKCFANFLNFMMRITHLMIFFPNINKASEKKHSTSSATVKVVNAILEAFVKKLCCASLFIDLSKVFETVDHGAWKNRLTSFGSSEHAVGLFSNYLNNRTRCVKYEKFYSNFVTVHQEFHSVLRLAHSYSSCTLII